MIISSRFFLIPPPYPMFWAVCACFSVSTDVGMDRMCVRPPRTRTKTTGQSEEILRWGRKESIGKDIRIRWVGLIFYFSLLFFILHNTKKYKQNMYCSVEYFKLHCHTLCKQLFGEINVRFVRPARSTVQCCVVNNVWKMFEILKPCYKPTFSIGLFCPPGWSCQLQNILRIANWKMCRHYR